MPSCVHSAGQVLPRLGGYITHAGTFDRHRLEVVLARLAEQEQDVLEERARDAEHMQAKRERRQEKESQQRGRGGGDLTEDESFGSELAAAANGAAAAAQGASMMRADKRAFFLAAGGGVDAWKARLHAANACGACACRCLTTAPPACL